jgi:hypothetical protein
MALPFMLMHTCIRLTTVLVTLKTQPKAPKVLSRSSAPVMSVAKKLSALLMFRHALEKYTFAIIAFSADPANKRILTSQLPLSGVQRFRAQTEPNDAP